jgi:serine/threonine-protein phosphatase 2A regulatory subunit B
LQTGAYHISLLLTGSYHNYFSIYDRQNKTEVQLEATKVASKIKKPAKMKVGGKKKGKDDINPDSMDFSKKILHAAWHPEANVIAIGASNNLFIFSA